MNTSLLFKNAILRLYKQKHYTVDFAILKASDYADRNKLNAKDYEELLTYLAEEQEKSMQLEEVNNIEENTTDEETETIEENTDVAENTEETNEENLAVEE